MNEPRFEGIVDEQAGDGRAGPWEVRVGELAQAFPYPETPDLAALRSAGAGQSRSRPAPFLRPVWAAVVLVAVLALLAVPQVRAAVVRVFQLGVVRIFVTEPSPAGTESSGGGLVLTPELVATPGPASAQVPLTATPFTGPPPTALPGVGETVTETQRAKATRLPASLAGLAGQTTLEEAQRRVPFPVALPSYPAGLGAPDYVFVQEHTAPVLILAWSDPEAKGGVGLSLWMFLNGAAIEKFEPETVAETTVNGGRALWTQGAHMLYMRSGEVEARRLVLGNTLIWERKDITFRLETFLPLDEAVKVAESVR